MTVKEAIGVINEFQKGHGYGATITTTYRGPTARSGSRIVASWWDGRRRHLSMSYEPEFRYEQNHREAALEACKRIGFNGGIVGGELRKGRMIWIMWSR